MKDQNNTKWEAIAKMQHKLVLDKFGYDLQQEMLRVSDGCVCKDSKVWWKSENGPEYVTAAASHWVNISQYPDHYSINKPKYKVTYLD